LRIPLLVTLWFGRHLDDVTLGEFVERQRAEHASRLAMYEAVAGQVAGGDAHVAAVVDFGVRYERAIVEWLDALPYRAPVDAVARGEAS
jgi:hypothetical protein